MIARQLNENRYKMVCKNIMQYGRNKPLCPSYDVDIVFNESKYVLTIQPDEKNKIVALYAVISYFEKREPEINHVLITENCILSALLEMIIFQGLR